MMSRTFLLVALTMSACAAEEEPLGSTELGISAQNGLIANALTRNALTKNALTKNSLTRNALTAAALTSDVTSTLAADADARLVLKYIYSCAMPAGTSMQLVIGGMDYGSYEGELGLAPGWAIGACDSLCQERVSSCVLSRVNAFGRALTISLRGNGLTANRDEKAAYPTREGAYFGSIFADPMVLYTCDDAATSTAGWFCNDTKLPCTGEEYQLRRCSEDPAACGMISAGSCGQVCRDTKGIFSDCRGPNGQTWSSTMTTYLPNLKAGVPCGCAMDG